MKVTEDIDMPRTILATLALAALLAQPLVSGDAPREESQPYHAGGRGQVVHCDTNVGGACFALDGTETRVSLALRDATGLPVAAHYAFGTREPDLGLFPTGVEEGVLCGSAEDVPVPADAKRLYVKLLDPAWAQLHCGPGNAGAPTTGAVTATFA